MTTIQSIYQPLPEVAPPVNSTPRQAASVEGTANKARPRVFLWWVGMTFLCILCLSLLGAMGVASYFFLSSSSTAMRDAVMDSVPGHWHKHFAINVGGGTLALARFGVSFTHLPPDAKTALQCLDHGDVGIYELEDHVSSPDYALILQTADKSMQRRGWERIVGVVEGSQFVAVYAPNKQQGKDISCCVAVLDDRNLVVVSARGDTGPILELAQRHLHEKGLMDSHHHWR